MTRGFVSCSRVCLFVHVQILAASAAAADTAAGVLYTLDPSFDPTHSLNVSEVTAVAVAGRVAYVVQRGAGAPYVLPVDSLTGAPAGSAWGGGSDTDLTSPHGAQAAPGGGGLLWLTDITNHTVKLFSAASGVMRAVVGTPGVPGAGTGTSVQFSAPADVAIDGVTGTVYVSDGDGGSNNRVVALDAATLASVFAVGGLGKGVGKFDSPHSLAWDVATQAVYVADRGNGRVVALAGVGTPAGGGAWLGSWNLSACVGGVPGAAPWGLRLAPAQGAMIVADGGTGLAWALAAPRLVGGALAPCALLQTLPVCPAGAPNAGCKPHELAVDDATGDVYLAAVGTPTFVQRYVAATARRGLGGGSA